MFILASIFSITTSAQNKVIIEDEEPNAIIFISKDKAGNSIVKIMHEAALPYFREPDVPRFLLTDTKGRFAVGIGACLQVVSEYDFGGIVKNIDFYPSAIPARGSTGVRNQFQMDISTSSLYLKMLGRTKALGDILVYAAANFRGNNNTFRLLNAYVQFLGVTAGFSYGNFMDLAAIPNTIDFSGPSGAAFYRTVQLAYTYSKLKHWEFSGAVEMPKISGTYEPLSPPNSFSTLENVSEAAAQRMPDFTANIKYKWGEGNQIRVAGIVRSMTYDSFNNIGDVSAKSILGWGTQLSTTFNITKRLEFMGQINYGKGIRSYLNDHSNFDIDLVPDPDDPSKMQTLPMLGWFAGLQYNFSPKVFMSSTYSVARVYSENGWPSQDSDFFKYSQYFVCNIFWKATKGLQLGAEYLRGWRTGFLENSTRHANRINAQVQYSF